MRAWNKIHEKNETKDKNNVKLSDVAQYILSKENSIVVNFDQKVNIETSKIHRKYARFPPNPEANWGPKRRAGKTKSSSTDDDNKNISKDVNKNKNKKRNDDNHNLLNIGSTEIDHHNDKITTTTTSLDCDTNKTHQSSPSSSPSTKKSKHQ